MLIKLGSRVLTIRLWVAVIIVSAVAIMVHLGLWQLQRAEEKRIRIQQIAQQSVKDNVSLAGLAELQTDIQDMPVSLTAEFDAERYFLLDNRTHQGRVGFQVIQVARDVQTGQRVLVNLGWLAGTGYRDQLPEITSISGQRRFSGVVWQPQQGVVLAQDTYSSTWPVVIQSVDVNKMSQHYGENLLPYGILLDKNEDFGWLRNWQPVVMPPEKHQAYAVQWFLLALATLIVSFFAASRREDTKKDNKVEGNTE